MGRRRVDSKICGIIALFILLLLLESGLCDCIPGKWIDLGDGHQMDFQFSRTSAYINPKEYIDQACRAEVVIHNGYSLGYDLAHRLESRMWVADDPSCRPLNRSLFVEALSNRHVLLFGDSVMHEVWSFLVCWLDGHNASSSPVEFINMVREINPARCPDFVDYCSVISGNAMSKTNRFSLDTQLFDIHIHTTSAFLFHMRKMRPEDVVVMNWGLHFHLPAQLKEHLISIRKGIEMLANPPHFLYLETVQPHFPSPHGYYEEARGKNHCIPLANITLAAEQDWRNIIAHQVFAKSKHVKMVRIVDALRSEWDAHSARVKDDTMDCVHLVMFSGAMEFVARSIFNAIIDLTLPPVEEYEYQQSLPFRLEPDGLMRDSHSKTVWGIRNSRKYYLTFEDFVAHSYSFADVQVSYTYSLPPTPEQNASNLVDMMMV